MQGTLVLQITVNEQGRTTNISVLSPLGFGLDERAQAAVETWKFVPGMKDGKPVKIQATVEVKFRFPEIWFDEKAERQRTSFNLALQSLNRGDASQTAIEHAVKSMQDLSRQAFPPAMYTVGLWETKGEHVTKDSEDGFALIQKAASKNYGPAVYQIALRRMNGDGQAKETEKGLEEMRQAATMGSPQAQFYLGNRYENGDGVPRELNRARRYFRLCAVQGVALCQYRLGNLLFAGPDRPESDYMQAVALFQLAAEQGQGEAKEIAARETASLTPAQVNWVNTLKTQLVRK